MDIYLRGSTRFRFPVLPSEYTVRMERQRSIGRERRSGNGCGVVACEVSMPPWTDIRRGGSAGAVL